ncbi:DUF998 domain-containing protein [Nocardia niwae]|uniref:DUF998 domain-containing protein n=1 Tax=Nocardia niwae TaxID=626084 RepID=UPI001470F8F5|nr:DUF998 domain-containing protein [Nocardia niwae]
MTDTLGKPQPTQLGEAHSPGTRILLACGILAPLLNIVVLLILGAIRPDYNAWVVPDSNLELGPGGWMQITNYIVTGLLLLAFVTGVRRIVRTWRGATWLPVLLCAYALTFVAIGPILPDPSLGYPVGEPETLTVHGAVHSLLGIIQFGSLTAACFVLADRDKAHGEHALAWYSTVNGVLVGASYVAFALTAKLVDGGPAGLIERLGLVAAGSWVAVLAIRLIRRPGHRVSVD